jgi:hypothetical protein
MRFLLLNSDYSSFLKWLYSQNPGLENESYEKQAKSRAESLFSLADFYSSNLRKLGHEAWDIDVNNEFMQKAWARQHGLKLKPDGRWEFRLRRGIVPWLSRATDTWPYEILEAQIKHYKPDVLLTHTMDLNPSFLRKMKKGVRLLVGSHASETSEGTDFSVYDVMLSVVDNFIDHFRRLGVKSELLRFGFEPAVLERFQRGNRSIPVSFVGNLFPAHVSRIQWLEYLCKRTPALVWTPSTNWLPAGSSITGRNQGIAWGNEMFEILCKSRITLNHHIDVAQAYAGNLRLFEATGIGSLLITDSKKNMHEMFELGKEVVVYNSPEECAEMVQYYLEHDDQRETIARAGQQRTLRDHTYYDRMQQLVAIVGKYI